ncbi:hypothetical protein ACIBO9_23860 [Streptomyces prunicolor]|uniref:hypothetical protein n=1 Tax=Streptomyces prunicolor TaxID=67348 RepID=UPI0037CCCA87
MRPPYLLLDVDGVLMSSYLSRTPKGPVWQPPQPARRCARSLPCVDLRRPQITTSHPNGYLWKRDDVDTWLGDAPAIWIDDGFTDLNHEWAAGRTARGQVTALVQHDPQRTRGHHAHDHGHPAPHGRYLHAGPGTCPETPN